MIESILLWLMGKGLGETASKVVLGVTAAVFLVATSATLKSCYDNRVISNHEQTQVVKTLQQQTKSNDISAEQRSKDTIDNSRKDNDRKTAIEKEVDQPPSDASVALGCIRLRHQGYDVTTIPACRGH